jgi:hypothetical protein
MEAAGSSETMLLIYQIEGRRVAENHNFNITMIKAMQ